MAEPMLIEEEGDDPEAHAAVVVVVDDDVAEPALPPPGEAVTVVEVNTDDDHSDLDGLRGQADATSAGGVARSRFGFPIDHRLDAQRDLLLRITHVLEERIAGVGVIGVGVGDDLDLDVGPCHSLSLGWGGWWKTLLKANNGAFKSACHQIIKSVYP